VDSDIAGNRVGDINTQLFSWHWPGDDELVLPIVMSILDTTILSIMIAAIAGLPDLRRKIQELWVRWEEPNGDGDPHAHNVTPIFNNNTAAAYVMVAMESNIHMCF